MWFSIKYFNIPYSTYKWYSVKGSQTYLLPLLNLDEKEELFLAQCFSEQVYMGNSFVAPEIGATLRK